MRKNIIFYSALLVFACFFYVLYPFYLSFYLLIILCILPILSRLHLWLIKKTLQLNISMDEKQIQCTYQLPWYLQFHAIEIHIQQTHITTNQQKEIKLEITYEDFQTNKNEKIIPLKQYWVGLTHSKLISYEIIDIFKLFHNKKTLTKEMYTTTYPNKINVDLPFLDKMQETNEQETDHYLHTHLPTDTYDIKPYTEYDNIKYIHWKLSSKYDAYYVKDFLQQTKASFYVLFHLKHTIEESNQMFEIAVSVCEQLLKKELPFTLTTISSTSQIRSCSISTPKDLQLAFQEIFQLSAPPEDIFNAYLNELKKDRSFLCIQNDITLIKKEEEQLWT